MVSKARQVLKPNMKTPIFKIIFIFYFKINFISKLKVVVSYFTQKEKHLYLYLSKNILMSLK